MDSFKRISKSLLFIIVVAGGSSFLGIATVIAYQVFFGNDSDLKKSTILARINEETTIYTLDEKTRIGSFFDNAHRRYVPIEEVPAHMIRAMVASEDKNFYNHYGIDPIAISIAFWDGLKGGMRFKRGASTITQQTVKNIMDRREHTFKRKFKEMIRALQLERMYSKQQILEFYLNQFHVTANGNGIAIAARYYFNKNVRDLTLVEAAFIAGSVKAPSKYNPFIKYTKEAREKAWTAADQRKEYVLRRMYQQSWINKDELREAMKLRVPFNRGKFQTQEVALVSLIRGQLNRKEILDALDLESHRELDYAGLKIYTTLDMQLQEQAQLVMRRNLSRLEYIMRGFKVEAQDKFKPLRSLEVNQFYFGKVTKVVNKGEQSQIEIDFGLPKGIIPYDSLVRTAKILDVPTYRGFQHHLAEILNTVKEGDILFAEIMEYDNKLHLAKLELKKEPRINGGIIALDKGEVRAVVAGFDAQGFNRAMFATRQPGSVFKSVVYFAALQLGWTITDHIDNQRRLFPFQGRYYYPRPDHVSPYDEVSILWAGTKSENLASVHLTVNLLNKLNFGQFKTLLKSMDLFPAANESVPEYHYRVAKETGVQLDNDGIREHLLASATHDLAPDLIFSGHQKLLQTISKMWWGRGYLAELRRLNGGSGELSDPEVSLRINLVKNNYERMNTLSQNLVDDWELMARTVVEKGPEGIFTDETTKKKISHFRVLSSTGRTPSLGYIRTLPGEDGYADNHGTQREAVLESAPGRQLNPLDIQAIWGNPGFFGSRADITVTDVKLAGFLSLGYFNRIKEGLDKRYQSVINREDRFGLYQYFNHHDFRIILGLRYLVKLSQAMGVYNRLDPVLSFPLGTNAISVAEVAKIYQTFTNGKAYRYYEEGPENQLNFIRRIEDRDGNVLFEPKRQEFQLIDPCIASQLSEVLLKVVTHGTGRRARGELQVPLADHPESLTPEEEKKVAKIRVPAFGKTGTTNDYTTAYFAGYVPYPTIEKAPLDIDSSMVIASYVGYDKNDPMRRGGFTISGAYGGLPVWTDFAKALIKTKNYSQYLDRLDLNLMSRRVWPLKPDSCTMNVNIDLPRGIVLGSSFGGDLEVFGFTDIEREGEINVNEFEPSASVRSFVRLAVTGRGEFKAPLRFFKPFSKRTTGDAKTALHEESERDISDDETQDGGSYLPLRPSQQLRTRGPINNVPEVEHAPLSNPGSDLESETPDSEYLKPEFTDNDPPAEKPSKLNAVEESVRKLNTLFNKKPATRGHEEKPVDARESGEDEEGGATEATVPVPAEKSHEELW